MTAPGGTVAAGLMFSPGCDPPFGDAEEPSSSTANTTQAWKSTPIKKPTIAT
jgi:hypothetical protein